MSGVPLSDILVFGAHPDDVEIGCGGILARYTSEAARVVICDLTRGEMGCNGEPAQRVAEGEAAARILGVERRINLGLPDRGIAGGAFGEGAGAEQLRRCVAVIRRFRPKVVALPWAPDRHPDHVHAHRLLREAIFAAALNRYETEEAPHRVPQTVFYFINDVASPAFVVDVTPFWRRKLEALLAHHSQFDSCPGDVETPLNRRFGLCYRVGSQ